MNLKNVFFYCLCCFLLVFTSTRTIAQTTKDTIAPIRTFEVSGTVYGQYISSLPIYHKGKITKNKVYADTTYTILPFVDIAIDSTHIIGQSDTSGKFKVVISAKLFDKKITLKFSYPGWNTEYLIINTGVNFDMDKPLKIILTSYSTF